jgi:hypothetical protein
LESWKDDPIKVEAEFSYEEDFSEPRTLGKDKLDSYSVLTTEFEHWSATEISGTSLSDEGGSRKRHQSIGMSKQGSLPYVDFIISDCCSPDGKDFVAALKGKQFPTTAPTVKWQNGSETVLPWIGDEKVSGNTSSTD